MKFYLDDKLIYELNDTKKKTMLFEIYEELLEDVIIHKIKFIFDREFKAAFGKMKNEWMPKLKSNGIKMVPTDDDEFAELIFKQKGYKSRNQRDPFIKEKHQPPKGNK